MIDTPTITTTPGQPAAVIHVTIPRDEIQTAMGPAFGELMEVLAAQGIAPAGPFFSHHLQMIPDMWDFEVGVPVAVPVDPAGRVKPGELPAAKVARTTYHGGYEGLGGAWSAFNDWLTAEGHKPAANLWEFYVSGPESSDDPADYRTELNRPLVD